MTSIETTSTLDLITELRRSGMAVVTLIAEDLTGFFRSGHPDWRYRPDRNDDEVADWLLREGCDEIEDTGWKEGTREIHQTHHGGSRHGH
jgi:hypothetical protein